MSARGWADTLTRAAGIIDTECGGEDGERQLCADLRYLAALLELEITVTSQQYGVITMTAEQLLNAVTRGPAEQRETGR